MPPHPIPRRRGRLLLELPVALLLALATVYAVLRARAGDGGLALVADDEVLVRIDHVTGRQTADHRPGAHAFLPWLEETVRLDRRPVRYVLGASEAPADRSAPPLIVRARDGSSYSFHRIEVQVVLDAERAEVAFLDHGGTRESTARFVDAYARSALREAFGRFTPREIVLPENKEAATSEAAGTLARLLGRHGIRVLEISSSKPRFPDEYQEILHRRQVADQDVGRLVRERAALEESRGERLAVLREQEEREVADLERELAAALANARRAAERTRRQAEIDADETLAAATLERDERLARAALAEERHRAEARVLEERLARLESQGELAVRAALVERLGSIRFDLVPWGRDDGGERSPRAAAEGSSR